MAKTTIILVAGAIALMLGGLVQLQADELATRWEKIGPGMWNVSTDFAAVRGFELVGLYLMSLGLALGVVAVQRCLSGVAKTKRPAF